MSTGIEQCDWFPAGMRWARNDDPPHGEAVYSVGEFHLCEQCASLKKFARFKKKKLRKVFSVFLVMYGFDEKGNKIIVDRHMSLNKAMLGCFGLAIRCCCSALNDSSSAAKIDSLRPWWNNELDIGGVCPPLEDHEEWPTVKVVEVR
jgi:hypothetical protein